MDGGFLRFVPAINAAGNQCAEAGSENMHHDTDRAALRADRYALYDGIKDAGAGKKKVSTRQLVSMAMLGAISIVLVSVVHFPLIPAAAFLEYDPADIPILIGTFAYGSETRCCMIHFFFCEKEKA